MDWTTTYHLADPEVDGLEDLVETERLGLRSHDEWDALGRTLGRQLSKTGVARLPAFVRPEVIEEIGIELDRACEHVAIRHDRRSVYASTPDQIGDVDPSHPAHRESDWIAGHVTRDQIPPHSAAQRLYVSPMFKRLVASCVGVERAFEYADPLAGLVATVLPPGGCYGWHYDTNEFVVTISIRGADAGGRFEYCPDLRRSGDENLIGLGAVLDGSGTGDVRSVDASPGDLQIFRGRYSLHRVTEVEGATSRLSLVLSYADRPGVIGPVERTRRVYGRVTEAHLVAAGATLGADGLIL